MEVIANPAGNESNYDRDKEIEAFFETKAGVQGLVEAGMTKIPRFFIHPSQDVPKPLCNAGDSRLQPPVIDLEGLDGSRRADIVNEIRNAAGELGFFQIINHGVPLDVMEEMLASVKQFHEQPQQARKKWYSHDYKQPIRYFSNGDLHLNKGTGLWFDTLVFEFPDGEQDPMLFPEICRETVGKYIKHMIKVRDILSELLSEALGLHSDYLSDIECLKTLWFACHYYPLCPEPELTQGIPGHTDPPFLTILLQDGVGGLQFLNQNQWADIPPLKGAFVVNIGDLLQLISNDKFKAAEHRVLLAGSRPRTSVATLLAPSTTSASKKYGPLKELVSDKPPAYKETTVGEYTAHWTKEEVSGKRLSTFQQA